MQLDPRTVARDIPGIVDEIFPHLTAGTVTHFNSRIVTVGVEDIPPSLLSTSKLQRAMLFELAYCAAESLLDGAPIDWAKCYAEAVARQRVFFDAKAPVSMEEADREIASIVGRNLASLLNEMRTLRKGGLVSAPFIPGLEWVANGRGDFAIAETLIEVKCTAKKFSSADYRQVAVYWLMSYAASLEGRGVEWRDFVLLNPRRGELLSMAFDDLLLSIAGSRTKVETLLMFQSLVGTRARA